MSPVVRRSLLLGVFGLGCWGPSVAWAQEPPPEVRATQLLEQQRYSEALQQAEAAYQQRENPQTLYVMAVAHHRLGHGPQALDLYRRFLVTGSATEAQRGSCEAAIQALSAAPPAPTVLRLPNQASQPYASASPDGELRLLPVRAVPRRHGSLITTGVTLLSVGYGSSVFVGSMLAGFLGGGTSTSNQHFGTGAMLLFIPVLGPLVSGIYMPATEGAAALQFWTLPWLLTSGAMQVTGLALTLVGLRTRRNVLVVPGTTEPLNLAPLALIGGGGVLASGRF